MLEQLHHIVCQEAQCLCSCQDKHIETPGSEITDTRGGSHNAPEFIKPTQLVGGYAQISYHFNYYGPIGNQRDVYVAVRKMKE